MDFLLPCAKKGERNGNPASMLSLLRRAACLIDKQE